jgi:hypothetical protein
MQAFLEHLLGGPEQASRENNDGSCSIASFNILRGREINKLNPN